MSLRLVYWHKLRKYGEFSTLVILLSIRAITGEGDEDGDVPIEGSGHL